MLNVKLNYDIQKYNHNNDKLLILDKVSKARKMTPKYQEEFSKFQQLRIAKNS